MSSIVNKVKEVLSSDKKDETTTHNTHNTHTTGTSHTTSTSQPEGTHGPHGTRTANAADPRVDSDRDHRAAHNVGGTGIGGTGTGNYSSTTGSNYTSGTAPNTSGPHNSDALNKVDPRVDSDRDGSRTVGNQQGTTGTTGTGGAFFSGGNNTTTTGTHHPTGTTGTYSSSGAPEGTHGPHSSRVANAADPRVDSDRDGSRTAGGNTYGTTGTHGTGNTFGTTGNQFGSTGHTTGTHHSSGAPEGTYGPHSSRVGNAADPRVDSDRDGSRVTGATGINYAAGGNQTGSHGTHSTGNNFGTTGHTGHTGTHTGSGPAPNTSGPHKSDALNKLDPRVDSDRDGSRTVGNTSGTSGTTGTTGTTGHTGHTGTHNTAVGGYSSGAPEGTHGPHSSRVANAADPRVDSDRDGSRTAGGNAYGTGNTLGNTGHTGHTGHTGTHNTAVGGSGFGGGNNLSSTGGAYDTTGRTGHTGTHNTAVGGYSSGAPEGIHGPHSSRVANAADPRVDSDRDGSRTAGGNTYGTTGTHGTTGAYSSSGAPEGTHGPHGSRVANAADPRVDSDRDGSRTAGGNAYGTSGTTGTHTGTHHHGAHSGTGPAPNTAGPHKSDALNKLDPRVDSDLDGSKTVGQEKTFEQSNTSSYAGKDPHDAAQVPPSVMQKHIGEPVVAHDNPDHGHAKRHSVSHQEEHRGL